MRLLPNRVSKSGLPNGSVGENDYSPQHTNIYTVWQRNCYEHVMRNETEWQRIRPFVGANDIVGANNHSPLLPQNRFGAIADGVMRLNEWGEITEQFWLEIPQHFPNVLLDEFAIMPNHVHGIIIVNDDSIGIFE